MSQKDMSQEAEGKGHKTKMTGLAKWKSTRFLLCYLASAGVCISMIQRVSFSLAIVCMVNHTALRQQQQQGLNWSDGGLTTPSRNTSLTSDFSARSTNIRDADDEQKQCRRSEDDDNDNEDGPLVWDKGTRGQILAAYYVGNTLALILCGYVVRRLGARLTVSAGVFAMSVCHILCHPAALLSPWAVFVLRFLMGVFYGTPVVGVYDLWRKWAPRTEQSQLLGITFSGVMLAGAVSFSLTALLCQYGFWGGWPSVFYIWGGVGVVWAISWFTLVTNSPETHPRISSSEVAFIVSTRADASDHTKKVAVPWRRILLSPCAWAFALSHFANFWGVSLLFTNLPTFLHEVMHFNILSNGVYSMLPYTAQFLVISGTGFLFDAIIRRHWLPKRIVRKLCVVVSDVTPAVLLVTMSHLHCDQTIVTVVLLVLAVGIPGIDVTGGYFVNPYDIAPRYVSSIFTISLIAATSTGFMNSYLVAAVTVDNTREQWQLVFYVTAGLHALSSIVFCTFAKMDVQPWATETQEIETDNPAYVADSADSLETCQPPENAT